MITKQDLELLSNSFLNTALLRQIECDKLFAASGSNITAGNQYRELALREKDYAGHWRHAIERG